jgi:hypothetical protein
MIQFNSFINNIERSINGSEIKNQVTLYNNIIQQNSEGDILINRANSRFKTIGEAVQFVKSEQYADIIHNQIQYELYEEIGHDKIINIIRRHSEDKITDTLIESVISESTSKRFTINPIILEIKKINNVNRVIENRLDYVLEDGSKIIITEETQKKINDTFGRHPDVIEYIKENKENFLNIINQLEE